MVSFIKCARTFNANDLTWEDLALPGVDGRMHVISYVDKSKEPKMDMLVFDFAVLGIFLVWVFIIARRFVKHG